MKGNITTTEAEEPFRAWLDERPKAVQALLERRLKGTREDLGSEYDGAALVLSTMLSAAPQPDHIVELLAHGRPDADLPLLRRVAEELLTWHNQHAPGASGDPAA